MTITPFDRFRFSVTQLLALAELAYAPLERMENGWWTQSMSNRFPEATIRSLERRGLVDRDGAVARLSQYGRQVHHRVWWHFATYGRNYDRRAAA